MSEQHKSWYQLPERRRTWTKRKLVDRYLREALQGTPGRPIPLPA